MNQFVPKREPHASRSGVFAVVPAFNEASTIGDVVRNTLRSVERVVVIDDASTDGTATVALSAGAEVVRHPINLGQGAAIQTGITHSLAEGARYIVTLDADGQHEPDQINLMMESMAAAHADVALGSRFKGEAINIGRLRRVVLKLAVLFTRLTTGLDVSDSHNGFRMFSAAAARQLQIRQNRMAHASEILEEISRKRVSFVEVPVTVRYTDYSHAKGQSNLDSVNILLDLIMSWLRK